MSAKQEYKTEPLKTWGKAKELRRKLFDEYLKAHERNNLRYAGSTAIFTFHALPYSLDRNVINMAGEPYGATLSYFDFGKECLAAARKVNISRTLCAYLQNYLGSIILDKYILPDGTVVDGAPIPDFIFATHACCTHAKWYQLVSEYEGGVPAYFIDTGGGLGERPHVSSKKQIDFVVTQLLDALEQMEKRTGRKCNDEWLVEGINNHLASLSLWAEICTYNKAIPAPLDEKTMYSQYVFNSMSPYRREVVEFYKELRDEVKDRVARQIAAVPNERVRIMHEGQPPWKFLDIFRTLQQDYGVVSIGSFYTFCFGLWSQEPDGTLVACKTPSDRGVKMSNREEALRTYVESILDGVYAGFGWYSGKRKADWITNIARQWKVNAVFFMLNRGCEGLTSAMMESRLSLLKEGYPVFLYEGNMGDPASFNLQGTWANIENFMAGLGIRKLN